MNLDKLFETQKALDDRIVEEKGLQGVDLLDKKILALQVELGELANEWQLFKFWKDEPKPRTEKIKRPPCKKCEGVGYIPHENGITEDDCNYCNGEGSTPKIIGNPLLEEYVDCLHFILGIGNDLGYNDITEEWVSEQGDYSEETTTDTLILLLEHAADVYTYKKDYRQYMYETLFLAFIALGLDERHLGFTWNQIEQAYYQKNEINHERQDNGY